MSSELQSGLVICKNFTHIWSKVRHKYIIKKQQQQKKTSTHEHTEKDKQTSCLFLENSLKLCPYVVLSILPSLLGCCDNKCKSIVEDEELFKCKPVLVSQMTQEV